MYTYATRGTCSHHIEFDVKNDNTLTKVRFIGGCPGNTQAVAKLVAVQGTLKSLVQHHSSKASILQHLAFCIVQLSHLHMTTGKTID